MRGYLRPRSRALADNTESFDAAWQITYAAYREHHSHNVFVHLIIVGGMSVIGMFGLIIAHSLESRRILRWRFSAEKMARSVLLARRDSD